VALRLGPERLRAAVVVFGTAISLVLFIRLL
jgi:hypothetical protein